MLNEDKKDVVFELLEIWMFQSDIQNKTAMVKITDFVDAILRFNLPTRQF